MRNDTNSHQMSHSGDALSGSLTKLASLFTPTKWTTPLNLAGHRRELVRTLQGNQTYERPFEYPAVAVSGVVKAVNDVRRNLGQSHPLQTIVENHLSLVLDETRAISSRNDPTLRAREREVRPLSPQLVATAHQVLTDSKLATKSEKRLMDAPTLATDFRLALEAYGLTAWRVEIHDSMGSLMSVKGTAQIVKIRSDIRIGNAQRNRLLAHEIGGHVLRWANAKLQPESLVRHALGETVATEEGMAVAIEEQLDVSGPTLRCTYAVRVLGVAAGHDMGLVDLARHLQQFLPTEQAADLALRLRRGFVSATAPGCRTKDQEYLSGWLRMRRIRSESPADWQLLRATKWPLAYLGIMRELGVSGQITAPIHEPSVELLGIRPDSCHLA